MTTPSNCLLGNLELQLQAKETGSELCSCCVCQLPGCLCSPHCLLLQDSAANQKNEDSRFEEGGQKRAISVLNIMCHSYSSFCNDNIPVHGWRFSHIYSL